MAPPPSPENNFYGARMSSSAFIAHFLQPSQADE